MQNQRQNGRPNAAVRMAGLFLVLFCVAAVLIPAKHCLREMVFLADYIHFTESKRMYCGDCDSGSLDLWGAGAFEARTQSDVLASGGGAGIFLDSRGISANGGIGGISA